MQFLSVFSFETFFNNNLSNTTKLRLLDSLLQEDSVTKTNLSNTTKLTLLDSLLQEVSSSEIKR